MAEETYPQELRYYREHDWVRVEGEEAVFGITWFAQNALGEIVYAELPAVGDTVTVGATYGELESVKAVAEVFAPIGGKVIAVNTKVGDNASLINESPQGEGWIVKIEASDPSELDSLMDEAAYQTFLSTQH